MEKEREREKFFVRSCVLMGGPRDLISILSKISFVLSVAKGYIFPFPIFFLLSSCSCSKIHFNTPFSGLNFMHDSFVGQAEIAERWKVDLQSGQLTRQDLMAKLPVLPLVVIIFSSQAKLEKEFSAFRPSEQLAGQDLEGKLNVAAYVSEFSRSEGAFDVCTHSLCRLTRPLAYWSHFSCRTR